MIDEPESGLDQEAQALLEAVVSDRTNPFRTVLMTTHNLERGLAMGHRTAILVHGKIAFHESVESMGRAAVREAYNRHSGAAD
jgi:ABC-type multidrug transport system ATPase subunit